MGRLGEIRPRSSRAIADRVVPTDSAHSRNAGVVGRILLNVSIAVTYFRDRADDIGEGRKRIASVVVADDRPRLTAPATRPKTNSTCW